MPNHVYNKIYILGDLSAKQINILEKIKEIGLCEYYLPMSEELEITSPAQTDEEKDQYAKNLEKYGYGNWYYWKIHNYGTKWGDYDKEVDIYSQEIYYTTAWSPLNDNMINRIIADFPNIYYNWEEETGYGAEYEYYDGRLESFIEYDAPIWESNYVDINGMNFNISRLMEKYKEYSPGFYYDYDYGDKLGDNFNDALLEILKREHVEDRFEEILKTRVIEY